MRSLKRQHEPCSVESVSAISCIKKSVYLCYAVFIYSIEGLQMKKPINNRKDFLLLLLYSPGLTGELNESVSGRTRLTKLLFLFKKEALQKFKKGTEINEDNFYEFFAWNFGPFSKDVYDDLQFFKIRNFIESRKTGNDTDPEEIEEWLAWNNPEGNDVDEDDVEVDEYSEEEFFLTAKGIDFTRPLYESLSDEQRVMLREFKSRLSKAPLRAILKYVYSKYDDFITKSVIKNRVLGQNGH